MRKLNRRDFVRTTTAAGVAAAAQDPDGARALLRHLTSPSSAAVIKSKGLDPVAP